MKLETPPSDRVAAAQARPVALAFRATLLADLRAALAASASPADALQAARNAFARWPATAPAEAVSEALELSAAAAIPGKFQVSSVKFQGAGPEAGAPLETSNLKLETFRNSAPLAASFFSPDAAAAGRVAAKEAISAAVFKKLLPELRGRAFTVTGLAGLDEIARVRAAIEDFARGQTTDGEAVTWDKARENIISDLGWEDGEAADRRATLLLRTHGFQAYQAATWETAQADDDTTHLQYMTMEDDHVRDSHAALDGLVLPKDDPFWDAHYPPWDWGCRCSVRPINPDLLEIAKAQDAAQEHPENANVLDARRADLARNGKLDRVVTEKNDAGEMVTKRIRFDITPPRHKEDGATAFQWHPSSLKLPLADVLARYSPEEQAAWRAWAARTEIAPGVSVAQWAGNPPGDIGGHLANTPPDDRPDQPALPSVKRLQRAMGDALEVINPHSQGTAEVVAHIREAFSEGDMRKLSNRGVRVQISDGPARNFLSAEAAAEVPRGWEGVLNSEGKQATLGDLAGLCRGNTATIGKGMGKVDTLAGHEIGHVLDNASWLSRTDEAYEHHKRLFDRLTPYQQQGGIGGAAGREEMVAEGFGILRHQGYKAAVKKYDREFVDWIKLNMKI